MTDLIRREEAICQVASVSIIDGMATPQESAGAITFRHGAIEALRAMPAAPDPRDEVIRRLREALMFYADAKNYEGVSFTDICGGCSRWSPPKINQTTDNGNIARAALAFAKEQPK